MTHADHFLSRLDRVSLPHVELALSLYRDDELLRYILQSVRLPEQAERVAIALKDGADAPYIIVTRDGKFVTCLGEGMSPGELPVISRGQVDGITNRVEAHRDRLAERQKMFGQGGQTRAIARRIYDRGNDLSREEFMAYASWQPILAPHFFKFMIDCGELAINAREALVGVLKRTDKPRPGWNDKLHEYWKMSYACSHFAVLAAMGTKSPFEGVVIQGTDRPIDSLISGFTMLDGIFSMCVKGLFSIAKIGKPLLPFYKQQYEQAHTQVDLRQALLSLIGIAARHGKLRTEVKKTLLPVPPRRTSGFSQYNHTVATIAERSLDEMDESDTMTALIGAMLALELTKSQRKGSPFHFEDITKVPSDLARSLSFTITSDVNDPEVFAKLLLIAPIAARAAPEDLYLPKAFIEVYRKPWRPEDSLALLESYKEELRMPVPKPKGPTRNGPCPCGSGKKYKRCCSE
ncbi:MAG: SEC-C domain-containing protein [Polyangiaceae bacterium]|nr:SEC-C domain-containing protein [Polyangiaceae bacterium]